MVGSGRVSGSEAAAFVPSAVLDSIADPVIAMSAVRHEGAIVELRYEFVNPAAAQILGRRPDALIGRGLLELFPAHRDVGLFEVYCDVIRSGTSRRLDVPWVDESGVTRSWELALSPFADGFVAVLVDVTDRVVAIQMNRARAETFEMLAQHVGGLTFMIVDRVIEWVSPAVSALLGWSERDRPVGEAPEAIVHPDDVPAVLDARRLLRCHRPVPVRRYRIRHVDGTFRWMEVVLRRVDLPSQQAAVVVLGALVDVHEQTETSEALRQARARAVERDAELDKYKRLATLGRMARGLAHDVNNLLVGVQASAELASGALGDEERCRTELRRVKHAAGQIAELMQNLLDFAGTATPRLVPVDVSAAIRETVDVCQPAWPDRVVLDLRLAPSLVVQAEPTRIRQIVLNLLMNAVQACDGSGSVIVTARRADSPVSGGALVEIQVADTGCGIAPADVPYLFDPFFSTRVTGRGLGLSVVHGIVRSLGGHISVSSELGRGSEFRVVLPASRSDVPTDAVS